MKKTALFLLLPILLLSNNIQACPVWYVGKIKIVDQYFNEIDSAKICKYFNSGDSFYLPKTYGTIYFNDSTDGKDFRVWAGGGFRIITEQYKFPKYRYKITAKGYADLYLKDIILKGKLWKDTNSIYTVLYIVMPTKEFVVKRRKTILQTTYRVNETLTAKDTSTFNLQKNEYTNLVFTHADLSKSEKPSSKIDLVEDNTDFATETYPNPVKISFQVNIPNIYELGQKVSFYNLAGQELKSFTLYQTRNKMDLDWLENGTYFFIIYDENGNGIHKEKLVKI